jgi:Excalibur calcium-binding domain
MRRRTAALVLGVVAVSSFTRILPVGAATSYANCTALHRAHRYGVAKSTAAANEQVNSNHYRPFVSKPLYNANSGLDRDKDGTACEVSR